MIFWRERMTPKPLWVVLYLILYIIKSRVRISLLDILLRKFQLFLLNALYLEYKIRCNAL